MNRKMLIAGYLLFVLVGGAAAAHATSLRGVVLDAASGEKLSAATVHVVGTSLGATTDLDGSFMVLFVPPGAYELRVSCEGYGTELVKGVEVGEKGIVEIEIKLERKSVQEYKIDDLVVSADRILSTEAAVLAERQLAATIGDAISVEMVAKSPDATSSDILKRVTGLSIVDNKFVFIRGVTDRYNGTTLNGVSVTSTDTDVDKKSFTFDIIPSNLIASTTVVKSATPDLPGDFSGGLVQIRTLEFPEERILKLSASSSYDGDVSTKGFLGSQGGDKDWLGYDDGSRSLPPGDLKGNDLARALPNSWTTRERTAPLNASYGVTYGDHHGIGRMELGYVAALLYRSNYQTTAFEERPTYDGFPIFHFEGTRYKRSVLWGGLLDLNLKLSAANKVSFRNNYIQTGEEMVSVSGGLPASGEYTERQTIKWDERTLHLAQVSGSHTVTRLRNVGLEWRWYRSNSEAEEPDRRHVEFEQGVWRTFKDNYRSWSAIDEQGRGFGLDLAVPVAGAKVKAGWLGESRDREFTIDAFSTDPSSVRNPNYELLVLPVGTVFSPENYGQNKFTFVPVTVFTGEYEADQRLSAWYAMLDAPLELARHRFRIAGGARVEDSKQSVETVKAIDDPSPFTARIDKKDVLPSVAFTYAPFSRLNLRLAYNHSVNRPEFREMANVLYYDLDRTQNVKGNPALKRAYIRNYDVRVEAFPNTGEVLAVSYFYKDLEDAIEERLVPTPERYMRTWFNSPDGKNYGWEFEVRKSLGFVTKYLERFSVAGNYTRVTSAVEYEDARTDALGNAVITTATRVMQGQAPWTANLSLLFSEPYWGTSVNVLFNKVGRRIDAVGDTRDEDVYEEPREVVDLAINQRVFERWDVKFSARNIGASDQTYTSGPLRETFATLSRGKSYSVSLSFNF